MNLITIEPCQHEDPKRGTSFSRPFGHFLVRRLWYLLQTKGVTGTWRALRTKLAGKKAAARSIEVPGEVLNLKAGEWVCVKSEAEILTTLDDRGALRGLIFVDEMRRYFDKPCRVHKRLERMFLEESKQYRSLKNTVLLEGVMCKGIGIGCDRSCFLFWREAWLRRIPPPGRTLKLVSECIEAGA